DDAAVLDTWVELAAGEQDGRVLISGMGPISGEWPIRGRLVGDYPRERLRGPILDIPDPFDWTYFHAAPLDQRIPLLRGDEWVGIWGLDGPDSRLMTRLPSARGAARLYGQAPGLRQGRPIRLVGDALLIDADRRMCTITWRGHFPISGEGEFSSIHIVAGVE